MRISKSMVTLLASIVVFSILIANVVKLYSYEDGDFSGGGKKKGRSYENPLGRSPDYLIWFLQISDIHLSIFRDKSRITEFREFCDYTISAIKPSLVLATGDLTDAKTRDNIGSKQFEAEWITYQKVLNESKVKGKTVWLDIRGNHDNFNVAGLKSKENFYLNYSVQGKDHPRSYKYQIKKKETYSFIGIDACLEPGPRRPFNFVGMLDARDLHEIHKLIDEVNASDSSYTIWFGHFPTSCILSQGEHVRKLIGNLDQGLAYVCGHLHTLGGLVPNMYTLQKDGFLELELGDWKDNRVFRLMAIDHGHFSFVDVQHNDWPVILVTNPKNALYHIPGKDDLGIIKKSTHIRILAFSLSQIEEVKVMINDESWEGCVNAKGPLYVYPFSPEKYSKGLHKISVYVKDIHGRERYLVQTFSIEGTLLPFGILSKIALMTDASTIFKLLFAFYLMLSILPLCVLRIMHQLVKENRMGKPVLRNCFVRNWLRRFWILSTIDRIFYPLVFYAIYLTFGPWSIGHIIEDHVGVIFAWGIYVNGTFLPGSFTYAYGCLQIVTFQIPITIILGIGVDHSFERHVLKPGKKKTVVGLIFLHTPFLVMFTLQLFMAYFFWSAYGTMAFILGPLRTWSCILALYLWHQALNLPEKCTRESKHIFGVKKADSDISLNSGITNVD